MEKYKTKSVEELTKTLKVLALKVGNPGLSAELKDFLCMLKAHKLRHNEDAHAFCESGGMQVLLDMLKCCEASSRDSTLVLGTIGNLCALNRQSRDIVRKSCPHTSDFIMTLSFSPADYKRRLGTNWYRN